MRRFVSCLVWLVVFLAAAPSGARVQRTLTEEQVACDRAQLGALASRTSVLDLQGGISPVAQSLFVTHSNRYGFFEGLVVGMPRFRQTIEPPVTFVGPGPEHQLGFHLNPSVRELLLNPERIPLAQISMTRETSTSSLVFTGTEHATRFGVQVRLRPTLGADTGPGPADLVIDNLAAPPPSGEGFRPSDAGPGRGLVAAGLVEPCHTRRTDLDRRVLAILQRTLRVDLWDPDRGLRYDTRIALFRDQAPGVFGADVYAVDPESGELLAGSLHLLLEAHATDRGTLRDGRLLVGDFLVPDNPPVEGTVAVVEPLFGGVESLYEPVASAPVNPLMEVLWDLPFDWADVLEETAWNPGGSPGEACGQGTAAEIAATPRDDPATELLALSMGDGLTADQDVYDRLVRDLAAIRAGYPAVAGVSIFPTTDAKSLNLAAADAATYEAIAQGEYHEWDCLNDWYELEIVALPEPATLPAGLSLAIRLEGLYALERVAEDYKALPGIASASPLVFPPPGAPAGTFPSLCADEAAAGVFRYFFDVPTPDGPPALTYYFTTSPDGTVDLVGVFNPLSLGPAPPPPWLPLVEECYSGLRYGRRG